MWQKISFLRYCNSLPACACETESLLRRKEVLFVDRPVEYEHIHLDSQKNF